MLSPASTAVSANTSESVRKEGGQYTSRAGARTTSSSSTRSGLLAPTSAPSLAAYLRGTRHSAQRTRARGSTGAAVTGRQATSLWPARHHRPRARRRPRSSALRRALYLPAKPPHLRPRVARVRTATAQGVVGLAASSSKTVSRVMSARQPATAGVRMACTVRMGAASGWAAVPPVRRGATRSRHRLQRACPRTFPRVRALGLPRFLGRSTASASARPSLAEHPTTQRTWCHQTRPAL